jgi:NitT/TauT family transport system substrate-binding protein
MKFAPASAQLIPAAAAILALVTGCSSPTGTSSGSGPLEQTTITVDAFAAIDTAGLFIALDKGLFRAAGLNVKINTVTQVQPQVDRLMKGKVDISSGDYVTYVQNQTLGNVDMHNAKPQLRIIDESSFLQPNVLTVLVPQKAKVKSIAQLKGARISVLAPQNISDVLIWSLLTDHGIPINAEKYPNVIFPSIGPAFKQGMMDAAFTPEPFVTLFEELAGAQVLADLDQGSTTQFPIQGYATTAAWAQQHPNTLRAFVKALNEGQQLADTDRPEVERVLEKFLQLPPVVADLVALPRFPLGVDTIRLQRTVTAMLKFGILPAQFSKFQISSMIYTP